MTATDSPPALYDLHLHTYWSYDAFAHLENHFKRATELGVRCLAITEHHVLDSQPEVQETARRYPDIITIPAAELTVNTSIGSVDLLCYGFPLDLPPALQQVLDTYHAWQHNAGAAICKGMQALGYDYTDAHRLEVLQSYRPNEVIAVQGTTHIRGPIQQQYFIERGFIAHIDEYDALRRRAHQEVAFPPYPAADFVLPTVKEAGVVVAIAHPHGYFNEGDLARMDTLRAECYLDGIECAHKNVPTEFTPRYRAYCLEHGLFSSGGSDSHTDEDIQSSFAKHGGADEWLDEFLQRVGPSALK
jgi:predicted metal-dependent phosphoesterase TrpH